MGKELANPVYGAMTHQYEKFWEFNRQPEKMQFTSQITAGANANDDIAVTPVFLAGPRAVIITDAFVAVSVNSSGVDANNTSAWALAGGGNTLVTKTFNADLVLNTSYNMGAIATGYLAANAVVTLAITNGTTADLNSAVCTLSGHYIPADSFLDGLKVIATDGGSVSVADGVLGVLAVTPSDASAGDNDEIYVCTDTELFKFAANAAFEGVLKMKYTEANTDDANIFFGFMNAFAANALVDNGGGPKATGDYVGFWKVDGGTQWYVGAQSNGTATPTADTLGVPKTTAATSDYVELKVKVVCLTSTQAQATFSVDGVVIGSVHFAYASATEMQLGFGLKNGDTNAETMYVEYKGYTVAR